MRGVGAAAVGVVAVVTICGCAAGGEPDAKSAATMSDAAAPDPVVASTEPEYLPGPEGALDRLADEKGWAVQDSTLYASASAFVSDICESLPVSARESSSRPQWLAESGNLDGDGKAMLQAGMPNLCPEWVPALKAAVSGNYERWYTSGTFKVVASPAPWSAGSEGEPGIAPGTYRTKGDLADCYWERTSKSGDILDNQFATSAQSITVSIRSGDGQFTSKSCGVWKPVK
ncbi:hypothetical protein FBY35_0064 [Streptomyces sp. SLBN-118]|nr:hypothetical protein FBY35_0064 [Streptomyces sp. SLBN-118]